MQKNPSGWQNEQYTSGCRWSRRRFRSAPLRTGWGTHTSAAALTAGAGTAEEPLKNTIGMMVIELLADITKPCPLRTGSAFSAAVVCLVKSRRRKSGFPVECLWAYMRTARWLPLLIEVLALLFNTGLDPGCDIIAQLGQGLILRCGQTAVILWHLWRGEGLGPTALSATHCRILHDILPWR